MNRGNTLVLGGTGFIGSHVCERLAAAGRRVVAVSRRGSWPWDPDPPEGVQCISLDLTSPSAHERLEEVVDHASHVVNLVGMLYRPGLSRERLHAVHVEGTERLLAAIVSRQRRTRVVHVSTTGVLGPTGPNPIDEDAPPHPKTPYETTKLEGETIATARSGDNVELVIARPGLVYGPRDLHLLALFRAIHKKLFFLIDKGRARWQPIHVGDVARAIVECLDRPEASGQVLHIVGREVVSVEALSEKIAHRLNRRIPRLGLPLWGALAVGALAELGCRPLGLEPPLSRSRVRTLTEDRLYVGQRATALVGFEPSWCLEHGLDDTIQWYRKHGYL